MKCSLIIFNFTNSSINFSCLTVVRYAAVYHPVTCKNYYRNADTRGVGGINVIVNNLVNAEANGQIILNNSLLVVRSQQ